MIAPFTSSGLIGDSGSLVAALLVGLCFGFVLERAGLGSSRKLTGQFYGTDLTVLRVMMTAILTAMLGLFWLSRLGYLDMNSVHMLPTYLLPQVLGGVIFGIGFVAGGYCPGTSCVAAASGKADGLALIGGMLGGIVLFNELFPRLEGLYDATSLGPLSLSTVLGVSPHLLMSIIVVLTVTMFSLLGRLTRSRGLPDEALPDESLLRECLADGSFLPERLSTGSLPPESLPHGCFSEVGLSDGSHPKKASPTGHTWK